MSTQAMNAAQLIQLGITIAQGVLAAAPEAVAAFQAVQLMVQEGRDPSGVEWATLDAAADAVHLQVQGAKSA